MFKNNQLNLKLGKKLGKITQFFELLDEPSLQIPYEKL